MAIKTYVALIGRASAYIRSRAPSINPRIGVILGSGLSKAVPLLSAQVIIPYRRIPGFPRTTVAGHEGKLILGKFGKIDVAVMQGRFHYYEGHAMESIAFPVRVLERLGLKNIIITAAVGSMRAKIKPGHFTVVSDHINLMGRNPLRAFHEEAFGEMFPDLSRAYDPNLRRLAVSLCRKRKIPVHEGVYVAVGGPSYETPAEIRAFRVLGGDVVGMSVVPEAIVASQMKLSAVALAWTANMASGMKGATLSHPEVLALGAQVSSKLRLILQDIISHI